MDRGLVVERVVVVGDGGDDWRAPSTVVVAEERRMREGVLHQLRVSDVRTLGRIDGRVEERCWPVFHGSESVEWNDVCSARRRVGVLSALRDAAIMSDVFCVGHALGKVG